MTKMGPSLLHGRVEPMWGLCWSMLMLGTCWPKMLGIIQALILSVNDKNEPLVLGPCWGRVGTYVGPTLGLAGPCWALDG